MWALHVFIAEISLAIVIQADLWHLSAMNNVFSARLDESSSFLKAILVVSYSRFGPGFRKFRKRVRCNGKIDWSKARSKIAVYQ